MDGDGSPELVAASPGERAGAQQLVALDLRDGAATRAHYDLGDQAAWWDAAHGVWLIDGAGLLRADTGQRVAAFPTPLAHVGPAPPARSRIVYDLDRDQRAELLAWSAGQILGFAADGASIGAVPSPARGALVGGAVAGGVQQRTTLQPAPLAVVDADGDGLDDLLLIEPTRLVIHQTGPGPSLGVTTATWDLPVALEDPALQTRDDQRWTTDAHLRDLDGDGRVDLLALRISSDGTPLGTRAEVRAWRGGPDGFSAEQRLAVPGGGAEVYPLDLDGDGDLDLIAPLVDIGPSDVARGLLDGRVEAELVGWRMDAGRYGDAIPLKSLRIPLRDPAVAWNAFADLSGDGAPDLAVFTDDTLRIWRGEGFGFEGDPWLETPVAIGVGELLVADLDGDGDGELVAWARGEPRLAIWGLAP